MNDELVRQVRAVQAPMVEAAESRFGESEIDNLRCVIRLTVEFFHFLQHIYMPSVDPFELRYVGESIFAGVDSFCSVSAAVRGTSGPMKSELQWDAISIASLRDQFIARYHEFSVETVFERRCRLLLDLFKLQIVFAGTSYD